MTCDGINVQMLRDIEGAMLFMGFVIVGLLAIVLIKWVMS